MSDVMFVVHCTEFKTTVLRCDQFHASCRGFTTPSNHRSVCYF